MKATPLPFLPFKIYYNLNSVVGNVKFGGGICYMPGFLELQNWIMEFTKQNDTVEQVLEQVRKIIYGKKSSMREGTSEPRRYETSSGKVEHKLRIWDALRMYFHGKFKLTFKNKIKCRLMSHLYPFYDEFLLVNPRSSLMLHVPAIYSGRLRLTN